MNKLLCSLLFSIGLVSINYVQASQNQQKSQKQQTLTINNYSSNTIYLIPNVPIGSTESQSIASMTTIAPQNKAQISINLPAGDLFTITKNDPTSTQSITAPYIDFSTNDSSSTNPQQFIVGFVIPNPQSSTSSHLNNVVPAAKTIIQMFQFSNTISIYDFLVTTR